MCSVIPTQRWVGVAVKDRMKSVGSIKKITKAMKMVSAAKLRAVQVRVAFANVRLRHGSVEHTVAHRVPSPGCGGD
jgi:hypothetical protein